MSSHTTGGIGHACLVGREGLDSFRFSKITNMPDIHASSQVVGGTPIVLDRTQKHEYAEFVTRKSCVSGRGSPVCAVASGETPSRRKWIVDCTFMLNAMLCRNMVMAVWIDSFARVSEALGEESTLTAAAYLSAFAPSSQFRFIAVLLPMAGNLHQSQPLSAATISSRSTAVSFWSKEPSFRAGTGTPSASRP